MSLVDSTTGAPSREPQQGRSRASFERMVKAAEHLLVERGNDDFTLSEVSKTGKVSIGSIYCRFDSKNELIRVVQTRVVAKIEKDQIALIERVEAKAKNLSELVMFFVDEYAESLKAHASIMRPMMACANTDVVVAGLGKQSHFLIANKIAAAMLAHRDEIKQPDPERAVQSAFRIIYAAIARYLGFGSAIVASGEGSWEILKEDLGLMSAAFLQVRPAKPLKAPIML